jgi:hypothetical protein
MSVPVLVSRCGGQRNTGGRALRVFVEIVAVRLAGMTRVATKHPRRCGHVASLIGLVHFGGNDRPAACECLVGAPRCCPSPCTTPASCDLPVGTDRVRSRGASPPTVAKPLVLTRGRGVLRCAMARHLDPVRHVPSPVAATSSRHAGHRAFHVPWTTASRQISACQPASVRASCCDEAARRSREQRRRPQPGGP